jgi:outer membrane protein
MKYRLALAVLTFVVAALNPYGASAQQRIGYVDSEHILTSTSEYVTAQQQIDRLAEEWEAEIEQQSREIDQMFQDYQARELLYTNEERQRRRDEIIAAEENVEQLRMQYFGPEGQLFQEQQRLMRPIQERILAAVEEVALAEGYDYVFDKGGDFLFLFAREQYDLTAQVLQELGINPAGTQ